MNDTKYVLLSRRGYVYGNHGGWYEWPTIPDFMVLSSAELIAVVQAATKDGWAEQPVSFMPVEEYVESVSTPPSRER